MHYLKFRVKYKMFIGYFVFFIGTISIFLSIIWKTLLFYFIGLIVVLTFVERVVVKCPYCGKRPVSLLRQFPEKCPHCNEEFLDEQVGRTEEEQGSRGTGVVRKKLIQREKEGN